MTPEELAKLTPEEKRARIAQVRGVTRLWSYAIAGQRVLHSDVPDYLNDLNAMHPIEVEMFRDSKSDRWTMYVAHLCIIVDMDSIICATAAQRSDAFLLTVGSEGLREG